MEKLSAEKLHGVLFENGAVNADDSTLTLRRSGLNHPTFPPS
jgi:hypothetical protein